MATRQPEYTITAWDNYAACQARITTYVQHRLYCEVAKVLHGRVIDLGCGSAKLAAYVADAESVTTYVGIDTSPEMLQEAKATIELLNRPSFEVHEGDVQNYCAEPFDVGVSLMSYYAWQNTLDVLQNIFRLIKPGGTLVLATANADIDIHALLQESHRELVRHPDWQEFKRHNLSLAGNSTARFNDMDTVVRECQMAGFKLESCHKKFYRGGMNFITLTRR